MATLGNTVIQGTARGTQAATAYDHLVRLGEFEAALIAYGAAYSHATASVASSHSLVLSIDGQAISGSVRVKASDFAANQAALGVETDNGLYALLGTTASTAAAGNHTHAYASGSVPGLMSPDLWQKLDGIAANATANQADAWLLDRTHHTGTQGYGSIYDFATGVGLIAVPLAGGTMTGLLEFGSDGMLRLANLTDTEIEALPTPGFGTLVANSTYGLPGFYTGSRWIQLAGSAEESAGSSDNSLIHGDVVVDGTDAATIQAGAVDRAMMAAMQSGRILGRYDGLLGDPQDLTPTQVRSILSVEYGATANQADAYLLDLGNHTGQLDATQIYGLSAAISELAISVATGGTLLGPLAFAGTENWGLRLAELSQAEKEAITPQRGITLFNTTYGYPESYDGTEWLNLSGGNVTSIYGHVVVDTDYFATIQPGVVTRAMMADLPYATVLGRHSAGTGVPEAVTMAQLRSLLNVEDGATANLADAWLLDRTHHTGQQNYGSIYDFAAGVAAYAVAGSGWNEFYAPRVVEPGVEFSSGETHYARHLTEELDPVTEIKVYCASAPSGGVARVIPLFNGSYALQSPHYLEIASMASMAASTAIAITNPPENTRVDVEVLANYGGALGLDITVIGTVVTT